MATNTPNLKIPKPEGNEYYNRQNFNNILDVIDQNAASKEDVSNIDLSKLATKDELQVVIDDVTSHKNENTTKFTEVDNNIKSLNKIKKNVTITSTAWTLDSTLQLYKYQINDVDITANAIVNVNIHLAYLEKASSLKASNESFDGYVLLYATEQPSENIICDYIIAKQVM